MYTRRLVIFLLHNNNSIYFTPVLRQDLLFWKAKQSTFEQLFHLKASDLFTGVLFIYFVHATVQRPSCFPLNLSHEPLFLCWDHSVASMKTVELSPPPSRTNFHAFSSSLVPFLIFLISTAGTVRFSRRFHPQSTPENSNLQGNRDQK